MIVVAGHSPEYAPITYVPPRRNCLARSERPCPYMGCEWHLWNAVSDSMRRNGYHNMPETCVLDVTDRGEQSQDEVAAIIGVTRQRIEQDETAALRKLSARCRRLLAA